MMTPLGSSRSKRRGFAPARLAGGGHTAHPILVTACRTPALDELVLSDNAHGTVAQAYGVFNADAGFANRGTFVIDRAGIVRFAEMNQPGEARDQKVWTEALAALKT